MQQSLPVAVNAQDWQEGPTPAPVTLVEYGDFQCGDCREIHHALKPLRQQFVSQMRFVYRHLPLTDVHPYALAAARASEAAGMMGQFWAMHDALLEGPLLLTPEALQQIALQIGLASDRFAAMLEDEATYSAVRADVDGIRATGIHTTPALFLNNIRYEGPTTTAALAAAITAALPPTTP